MKKSAVNTARLKNLLPGGKIGNKGGTGRPPDWLRAQCQKIVKQKKLYEWLGEVASGALVETKVVFGSAGVAQTKKVPADIRDRIRAIELLSDRGWGKAPQSVGMDPENPFPNPVVLLPEQNEGEPGGVS